MTAFVVWLRGNLSPRRLFFRVPPACRREKARLSRGAHWARSPLILPDM